MNIAEKQQDEILVLGIGNTIASDDGIGIYAARGIEKKAGHMPGVTVQYTSLAGFELITLLEGFAKAVIIDAVVTKESEPGSVYEMEFGELARTEHFTSPHSINLYSAVELGRKCDMEMPGEIRIIAIEIEDNINAGEKCTPAVEASLDTVIEKTLNIIGAWKRA